MTLEEFQNAAMERKQAKGRRPTPYDAAHREFAVKYAQEELRKGSRKSAVLRTLGVADATLSKWMGVNRNRDAGFRRVMVKSEVTSMVEGIRMVTPSGYRIEGLTVESAAILLRALG